VYAWKNYPTSTKLTLFGAPVPSIDGKLFCFCNSVGATNCFLKVSWKSVHTPQEDSENPPVAQLRLQKTNVALENQLNTTARGFKEIFENAKPICLK
jgi:hypothetical protein